MPGTRKTVMKRTGVVPADSECERNASRENRGSPGSTQEGLLTQLSVQGRSSGQDPRQEAAKWRPKIEEELARLTVLGEREGFPGQGRHQGVPVVGESVAHSEPVSSFFWARFRRWEQHERSRNHQGDWLNHDTDWTSSSGRWGAGQGF